MQQNRAVYHPRADSIAMDGGYTGITALRGYRGGSPTAVQA